MSEFDSFAVDPSKILNAPPVQEAKSFYKQNEDAIHGILIVASILLLNRRMVRKAVKKQLDTLVFVIDYLPVKDMAEVSDVGSLRIAATG